MRACVVCVSAVIAPMLPLPLFFCRLLAAAILPHAGRRHADSINPRADSAKSHLLYHQDVKYT